MPATPSTPLRVLFLCTGNSARSQIAEALLTKKGGQRFIVASAGSAPASTVHPEAIAALASIGIDWTGHAPKGFDSIHGESWDFIITTCDSLRETCPTFPGQPIYAHWGVPDPALVIAPGKRETAFRDTLQLLSWRIDLMLALRPELLDRAAVEHRLRVIGRGGLKENDSSSSLSLET